MTDRWSPGGGVALPTAPIISLASRHSPITFLGKSNIGAPASLGTNPFAANEMLAFPFIITDRTTRINKVWWLNGSASGGNSSIAIYDADFTRLAQTASASGAGLNNDYKTISLPCRLGPGLYYCALAHDSATASRFFGWTLTTLGAGYYKVIGCWKQASITVGSLPATATPVACTSVGFPVFGVITRTAYDL